MELVEAIREPSKHIIAVARMIGGAAYTAVDANTHAPCSICARVPSSYQYQYQWHHHVVHLCRQCDWIMYNHGSTRGSHDELKFKLETIPAVLACARTRAYAALTIMWTRRCLTPIGYANELCWCCGHTSVAVCKCVFAGGEMVVCDCCIKYVTKRVDTALAYMLLCDQAMLTLGHLHDVRVVIKQMMTRTLVYELCVVG